MTANLTYPCTSSADRIPFVYIVGWSAEGVYYIGSRTARGCNPSDIGTTYFTSSKVVRKKWAATPPDIIQVLMTFDTKEAAIEFEHTALLNLEAHKTPQLLNKNVGGSKFFGSTPSDNHKAKIGASNKGRIRSVETRAKISAAIKGKTSSDETRRKISVAKKGKTFSEEHRNKMSAAMKGRTPWNKGNPLSLEHRAKISAAKSTSPTE